MRFKNGNGNFAIVVQCIYNNFVVLLTGKRKKCIRLHEQVGTIVVGSFATSLQCVPTRGEQRISHNACT